MLLGEKIKAARQLGGISMRELDRLAGVREGVTWKVEGSKTGNAETKTLAKLARVLGLNLEYVVNDVGEPPTEESVRAAIARARQPAPEAALAPPDEEVSGVVEPEHSLTAPKNAPSSNPPPSGDEKPASVRPPKHDKPILTPDPDGAV